MKVNDWTPWYCPLYLPFPDVQGVSQELSLHPVHLLPNKEGNLPPSALVPFCSYQKNFKLLGQERQELDNLLVCDKFKPTIIESQLCYSLDLAEMGQVGAKSGKDNGIFLLIDPDPYQQNTAGDSSFKVFIHTLSQYSTSEPGSYGMSTLKKMTGTKNFEQLPPNQKKCLVHNRQTCQTEKYLDHVQNQCKCTPWALQALLDTPQVTRRVFWHVLDHILGFPKLRPRERGVRQKTEFKR